MIEDAIPEEVVRVFAAFDREPPLLRWAPSSADIRDRRLAAVNERWQAMPRTQDLPPAAAVDANALGACAADTMIVEPVQGGEDFVYRHYGTAIAAASGADLTGRLVSGVGRRAPLGGGRLVLAFYRAAAARRQPLLTFQMLPQQHGMVVWGRLILPLLSPDGFVSSHLVGNAATWIDCCAA
ncbi:MAG: hypothetical protein EAZ99_13270 [Alphaproteobacteria bacterium]|nr:MAG: hypothetical protein EAZ99_13270 [Alphaproteobacteria bacterium]